MRDLARHDTVTDPVPLENGMRPVTCCDLRFFFVGRRAWIR